MNKKTFSPSLFGASSLIVIFSALVLVVFSLLSLQSAMAGERLSRVSAEAAINYADADFEAQKTLAKIREGSIPENVTKNGNTYEYSHKINSSLDLFVKVELDENGNYNILRWQSVRTSDWDADNTLDVWQPDN